MPRLTPLHFVRRVSISDEHGTQDIGAYYGLYRYITDCGRFMIMKENVFDHKPQLWHIREYGSFINSIKAVRDSGILSERFETRADALEALEALCQSEDFDS